MQRPLPVLPAAAVASSRPRGHRSSESRSSRRGPLLCRPSLGLLSVLVVWLAACDTSLNAPEPEGSGTDVAGGTEDVTAGPPSGDATSAVDPSSGADVSGVPTGESSEPTVPSGLNACGGEASLRFAGESAAPLEPCGCGGVLACNGSGALRCVGELPVNACGGCGVLSGEIGTSCGACGGTWVCGPEGDAVCVGAARPNGCGGCAPLAGAPGRRCESADIGDEADGVVHAWVCDGPDEVICRALLGDENACGWTGPLEYAGATVLPGDACADDERLCGPGVIVCEAEARLVRCQGPLRNAAGGCGTLLGVPGTACGCGGTWVVDEARPEGVRCEGGTPNACGGCGALSPSPGETCGAGNVVVCVGAEDTVCVARAGERNACGGTSDLEGVPGNTCGACNTGRWGCTGSNSVTCEGDLGSSAFNPCDGSCDPVPSGTLGGACGECNAGAFVCGEGPSLSCEEPTPEQAQNACGGCAALAGQPGSACGSCALWSCDESGERVQCVVDQAIEGCEAVVLTCRDLAPSCPSLHRECVEASGGTDATCGACLSSFREGVGEACEAEGVAAPTGVAASQGTSADHVLVTWNAVADATGYHVYRGGVRLTSTPVTGTSYPDTGAPAGGVPNTVSGVVATTDLPEGVQVSWTAATSPPGASRDYAVSALRDGSESDLSADVTGFRAARPVTRYEVQAGTGSWTSVGESTTWVDTGAPAGSLSIGVPIATRGLADRVVLTVDQASGSDGASRSYRVRAVNAAGAGSASSATSGNRIVGTISYQWEWSRTSDSTFTALTDATSRTATDFDIELGETRWYRVSVTAPGATATESSAVEGQLATSVSGLGSRCVATSQCPSGSWCPTDTTERRCSPRPVHNGVEMPFQWVPRGAFVMGSPLDEVDRTNSEGQVDVELTRDFFVQRTPVTQGQWEAVMEAWNRQPSSLRQMSGWFGATPTFGLRPSWFGRSGGGCTNAACPVEQVNWWDAVVFANALSIMEGLDPCYLLLNCDLGSGGGAVGGGCGGTTSGCTNNLFQCNSASFTGKTCNGYRLLTEAEWEYAARAGTTTATYLGDLSDAAPPCEEPQPSVDPIAWWCWNSESRTHPVGTRAPNDWGLFDMLGNVWEWTWTRYADTLSGDIDPLGPTTGTTRVTRGGSWYWITLPRAAVRGSGLPTTRLDNRGFRLARTAAP
ncbi:MAG: hypothetical protein EA398_11115 [Deltaproteobacteria bacterium]|nr:MAG: hypothetical protein EA398_11115 [Deltaproteobacteria bacterium]